MPAHCHAAHPATPTNQTARTSRAAIPARSGPLSATSGPESTRRIRPPLSGRGGGRPRIPAAGDGMTGPVALDVGRHHDDAEPDEPPSRPVSADVLGVAQTDSRTCSTVHGQATTGGVTNLSRTTSHRTCRTAGRCGTAGPRRGRPGSGRRPRSCSVRATRGRVFTVHPAFRAFGARASIICRNRASSSGENWCRSAKASTSGQRLAVAQLAGEVRHAGVHHVLARHRGPEDEGELALVARDVASSSPAAGAG